MRIKKGPDRLLSMLSLALIMAMIVAPAPVNAASAARPVAQGSSVCSYYSYSLPVASALRFFNGSQTVLLSRGSAPDTVYVVIDTVDYGDQDLPLDLGSIAAVMDYRAHLASWMGRVQVAAKYKPRVDACVGWNVDIVASSVSRKAATKGNQPLTGLADSGAQLPSLRGDSQYAAAPSITNGAPFFAVQGVSDGDQLIRPERASAVSAAALRQLPVAQVEALRNLIVERTAQDLAGTASSDTTSSWYVFEPYNYNNYYRSLTSQSNFNYLQLWRGWNVNQILGYTDRLIGNILRNPYIWRSVVASAENPSQTAEVIDAAPFGLKALNGINGAAGNWNQFEGQQPYPDFGDDQQQNSQGSLVAAAILGYDTAQARTFGTRFQADLNSLLSPWAVYAPWLEQGTQVVSASAVDTDTGPFNQRYLAIGQLQADIYSTNSELTDLRTESNQVSVGLVYLDPYYVYYTIELNRVWQGIFTTRPSYAEWLTIYQEIAGWDNVSTDKATLEYRYQRRQELTQWYYVVYYESLLYLLQPENHATLKWIVDVYAFLQSLVNDLWASDWAAQWSAQWSQSWDDSHQSVLAASEVRPAMEKLLEDEPAFREYLELNNSASDLLESSFADDPVVQGVSNNIATVLQDNDVTQKVNDAYTAYQQQLADLLQQTDFVAEIELFTEKVNARESQSLSYDKLVLRYEQIAGDFSIYQLRMYNAVAACFQINGNACNAYYDATVQAILTEPGTIDTIRSVGEFYEEARLYWHQFHRGSVYSDVETEASTAMQSTLHTVSDEVSAARIDFMATVYDVPEINDLHRNALDMLSTLRGQSGAVAAATATANAELDRQLQRMSELAVMLEPEASLYLPVVTR